MNEEFNDKKLSEVIEDIKKRGFKVTKKPTLIITKKDKSGYKTQIEIDLSQTVYCTCVTPKCGGRGRFEYFVDEKDGTLRCVDCKAPVVLRFAEIVDELRRKFAEENI